MKSDQQSSAISLSWTEVGVAFGIMVVAAFIAYGASLGYGFLNFDDPYLIVQNLAARLPTWANLKQAFTTFDPELYIPVTLLSYQFNYTIAGLDHPGFYHLTNLLLHALNGGLVAYVTYLLLGRKWFAVAAGLFFVVHPLNTEAAAWLSGRKDLLSSTFYLGSLALYLRYLYEGKSRWYWVSISLFILGLLAKASVLTLPVAILLLEILMRERKQWSKQVVFNLVPFVVFSIVFAGVAMLGKERVIGSSSLTDTILMAGKSTMFYIEKLFVPINLSPIYPYIEKISITSPDIFVPWILLIILIIASIVSLRWTKWVAITFLIFLITLTPSFLNIHKGTQVFFAVDRYAYLPMVWLVLLGAVGIAELSDRLTKRDHRNILTGVIVVWLGGLGFLSMKQTAYWHDDGTLFAHVLELYPESVSARTSLSAVFRGQGKELEEIEVLEKGLSYTRDVAYYTGIGSVAARQGKLDEAETLYNQARIADPTNPEPFFFLGSLEEQRGNAERAIGYYKEAVNSDPSYVAAYNNLGAIYLDQRKLPEAQQAFEKTLEWNPNFMEGYYNLFQVLELQKETDKAFPYLLKAYELNPDSPEILLAVAYRFNERGEKAKAIQALEHLLALEPNNGSAKRLLDYVKGT